MNVFSANYTPGQANSEYQASLRKQEAQDAIADAGSPVGFNASYDLKSRLPDWSRVLNMGAGASGLSMYPTRFLLEALTHLENPEWATPPGYGEYNFSRTAQLGRFQAELATRND